LRNILTLNPGYFNLRKPLEKRLYELARKHVGDQPEWIISEENLYAKSGSKATKPEFRRMLKTIIADDSILDYRLSRQESDKGENQVRFYQKDVKKLALAFANKAKGRAGKKAIPGVTQAKPERDLLD
jgi:plasmid replication initiation protein